MAFRRSNRWLFVLLVYLVAFSDTPSQAANWEGLWAQNKGQCRCKYFAVDTCDAGDGINGMPPVFVSRKKVRGPDLGCDVTKVVKSSDNSFELQAACASEGYEAPALVRGTVKRGRLELNITGKIEKFWSLDDYTSFSVKCRRSR